MTRKDLPWYLFAEHFSFHFLFAALKSDKFLNKTSWKNPYTNPRCFYHGKQFLQFISNNVLSYSNVFSYQILCECSCEWMCVYLWKEEFHQREFNIDMHIFKTRTHTSTQICGCIYSHQKFHSFYFFDSFDIMLLWGSLKVCNFFC